MEKLQKEGRRPRRNFLENLNNRQLFGRLITGQHDLPPRMLHTIPRRLVSLLRNIIPKDLLPKGHIFLGFLRCGYYLVSYTRDYVNDNLHNPSYLFELQFWLFHPNKQLQLIRETTLFSKETTCGSMFLTLSQWPHDDSKVLVIGYSLDIYNGENNQSIVQITVAAVPPLRPCVDCRQIGRSCLTHGFILHSVCSLGGNSVTDPRIMGCVNDHILINLSSSLICYNLKLPTTTQQKSKEIPSEPIISPPMSPFNEGGFLVDHHLSQWHLTGLKEKTNSRRVDDGDDDPHDAGWQSPSSDQEDVEGDDNSLFCIPQPIHEAVDWKLSTEISKLSSTFFCEHAFSVEKGNVFIYNERLDQKLFMHSHQPPPSTAFETIEMKETSLDLEMCSHQIGSKFCDNNNKSLIQISEYDGRILDFCPYSKIVTVSLCIQLDATTPQNFHNYRERLTHVYELFVILSWCVVNSDLKIMHLQHKLNTLDSKKRNGDLPVSFKFFQKSLRLLRDNKTPLQVDLNILSNGPFLEERSTSWLFDPNKIFCIGL